MIWFLIILFAVTFLAGLIPFYFKEISSKQMSYVLAFSGAFLLGISFLHLLPEAQAAIKKPIGVYVLIGFFLQFIIQKLSHGVEHGHLHHESHQPILGILIGLGIHAFLEGLPLGFDYMQDHTTSTLFFAVMAHKIPAAFTLGSLVLISKGKKYWWLILIFALISPLAGIFASYYGGQYVFVEDFVAFIIPVVMGAFIHISTTILFESGTKHHQISWKKIGAIILGIIVAGLTLLDHTH